jgi:prevent-host-death family protein
MLTVNIHDAKTQLSKLVEQAAQGESFIIAKAGKPMVKVIPLGKAETGAASRLGFMAGEIAIPDDFDQMGSEQIAAIFEGKAA